MGDTSKNNLLQKIILEASAYNTFEDIEKLVDGGTDLSMIPIQPLYISMLSSSIDQVANILPKLSREQRQALIDLDLWNKDIVDVESFEFWLQAYFKLDSDALKQDFVTSEDFYLYLKSRVNVHTFDAEDPMYPDHDFYFLTDDGLLLIEYGEDYLYPSELKELIRSMYQRLDVEGAYTTLFKLINDSFSLLQEENYHLKKDRLREFGFVDYYEASEKLHPYMSKTQIEKFIKTKGSTTGNIDLVSQNQSLHSSALVSFNSKMDNILLELSKVESEKRKQFLHFTFIRLINSTITLKDALKGGRIELTRIGGYTKAVLELGIQFVFTIEETKEDSPSIFERFDFFDIYKIGHSLIHIQKTRIKKILKNTPFENDDFEYFVGVWWSSFLEDSFIDLPKVKTFGAGLNAKTVEDVVTYKFWEDKITLFSKLCPFIVEFFTMFNKLKTDGLLHNDYYLNYEIDNIDFESILISSFINHSLGNYASSDVNKMGLSVQELNQFIHLYFDKNDAEYVLKSFSTELVSTSVNKFIKSFGFEVIPNIEEYLYGIIYEHLSGYEYDTLEHDDYQHVGGPILLNDQIKN